jgi:chromosome segregation and condensation protein ScpB
MTTATLEVLVCIAFRQPISQAEIDRLFDADKRGGIRRRDGRLRFATTEEFLQHFGLARILRDRRHEGDPYDRRQTHSNPR